MLNREEDFTGLLNHVKELKNKYVKAQQFATAGHLRNIEKIVQDLLQFVEPPAEDMSEFKAKIDELYDKMMAAKGFD